MKRSCICLLVAVLSGAFVPANAAVAAPQEQGATRQLLSAEIVLDISGPTNATVSAIFQLAGSGEMAVLLADLPGQQLEQIEIRVDGRSTIFTEERRSSALRALLSRAASDATVVEITYGVQTTESSAYRFALPVPEATPTGEERSVQLTVRLPAGARFAGNSFPPLLATASGEFSAATLAVPAQAHVVFGDAGLQLWAHQIMEWTALGTAIAMLLAG